MLYYTAIVDLYDSILLVSESGLKVLHRSASATMPQSSTCYYFIAGDTDT